MHKNIVNIQSKRFFRIKDLYHDFIVLVTKNHQVTHYPISCKYNTTCFIFFHLVRFEGRLSKSWTLRVVQYNKIKSNKNLYYINILFNILLYKILPFMLKMLFKIFNLNLNNKRKKPYSVHLIRFIKMW